MFIGHGMIPNSGFDKRLINFKRLWNNTTDKLKVIDFPAAVAEDILIHQTVYETIPDPLLPNLPGIVEPTASVFTKRLGIKGLSNGGNRRVV